ncbi:hypothetical protein C2845_PM15G11480 [Panicum miliaceum]|uniref:Uncharacterized protein n=1 Tax=Panicum miliaceum TaxID=4540 RepID=A0A3L6Q5V3_PANMI|nr:hypothetical protein C2845_PM15G11480 [Panicum miliaceum]
MVLQASHRVLAQGGDNQPGDGWAVMTSDNDERGMAAATGLLVVQFLAMMRLV